MYLFFSSSVWFLWFLFAVFFFNIWFGNFISFVSHWIYLHVRIKFIIYSNRIKESNKWDCLLLLNSVVNGVKYKESAKLGDFFFTEFIQQYYFNTEIIRYAFFHIFDFFSWIGSREIDYRQSMFSPFFF